MEYKEKASKQIEESPLPTGKEFILFVDDEPQIGNIVKDILEGLGYTVTTKSDSPKALKLFQKDPFSFDLVITDINMPNMTGDRLALKLMEIRGNIPIIFCTGNKELIPEDNAKIPGVKNYILKPFSIELLAETVRTVLDEGIKNDPGHSNHT